MRDEIKRDILSVLEKAIKILKTDEHPMHALSELSNHVIHDASIYQDEDSVSIAVLIYALSKTVGICCENDINYQQFTSMLEKAHKWLSKHNAKKYRTIIRETLNQIKKVDDKLKVYIKEVLDAARIKKGSKMYEHGISMARTAELLGITRWELQGYIGKQKEKAVKELPVTKRLRIAREIFK